MSIYSFNKTYYIQDIFIILDSYLHLQKTEKDGNLENEISNYINR